MTKKKEVKRVASKESKAQSAKEASRFTKGTPVPVNLSKIELVNKPKK